jgi:hypothetical protein
MQSRDLVLQTRGTRWAGAGRLREKTSQMATLHSKSNDRYTTKINVDTTEDLIIDRNIHFLFATPPNRLTQHPIQCVPVGITCPVGEAVHSIPSRS